MTTQQIKNAAQNLADTAKDTGDDAMDNAKSALGDMKSRMNDASSYAANKFTDTSARVSSKLADEAEGAMEAAADSGDRLADRLRRAAKDQTADSLQQRVLGAVATSVSDASGGLRNASMTSVVEGAQDFARKNPAAVMAGAAVIGFALARYMRPSGRRS